MASGQLFINNEEGEAPTTSGTQNQRKGDRHKSHFCVFCKKEVKRISMHFPRKHSTEEKVQAIVNINEKNKKRWAWKKLVQEGDNLFNSLNLKNGDSTPKTVRKPNRITQKRRYFTCKNCLGRIRTSSKKIHDQICAAFLKKEDTETGDIHLFYNSIIEGLNEELIERFTKNKFLFRFIEGLWEEKGSRNKRTIREKMRIILILENGLQQETKIKKPLELFFKPKHVDNFLKVIKVSSGVQVLENELSFEVPTKAQRLCRVTESFGEFLKVEYIKKEEIERSEEVNRFLIVFKSEAEKKIKNIAENTLRTKKLYTPIELPKATQIGVLINQLKEETEILIQKLMTEKNERSWRNLAENILLRLTIFNRRRGGAVEKMKLQDFKRTGNVIETLTEEFVYNLKDEEKEFLKNMKIIEIRHKCQNIISIYVAKDLRSAINLLINYRKEAKINENNPYVFAAGKNSINAIRCVDVLAKYRKIFPPELRNQLTATNLRKQGATATQVLNLTEQDVEEWASHMGHSAQVHKRYYRYKEKPSAILKTGKILSALDKGTLKHYKGKNLEEIPFESKDGQISVTDFEQSCKILSIPGTSQENKERRKNDSPQKSQKLKPKAGVQNKKQKKKIQRKDKRVV